MGAGERKRERVGGTVGTWEWDARQVKVRVDGDGTIDEIWSRNGLSYPTTLSLPNLTRSCDRRREGGLAGKEKILGTWSIRRQDLLANSKYQIW